MGSRGQERPRTAHPRSEYGGRRSATGQIIENYLINPFLERQDNQGDFKVDHNLSQNNRFFVRYSHQKTHRLLPATLPHGDAGITFGAGEATSRRRASRSTIRTPSAADG